MWDIFLKWFVPFICGAAITFASTMLVRQRAIKFGLQCLLRAEIIRSYEKYKCKGFCPVYAKEALTTEYKAYHALGGNDVATDLYKQMMAMQTEPTIANK